MAGDKFRDGDRVAFEIQVAPTVRKRREGIVLDVGARGVHVQFDDDKYGARWLRASDVKVVQSAKPDVPARVETAKQPVRLVPPPVVPAPATSDAAADDIRAWRDMGRGLVESAVERFEMAKAETLALKDALKDAERAEAEASADLASLRKAVA